ncbi:hypothetical protein ACFQ1I_30560 [Kitasatospora arboriphila]
MDHRDRADPTRPAGVRGTGGLASGLLAAVLLTDGLGVNVLLWALVGTVAAGLAASAAAARSGRGRWCGRSPPWCCCSSRPWWRPPGRSSWRCSPPRAPDRSPCTAASAGPACCWARSACGRT